jgi:hypothetical protein
MEPAHEGQPTDRALTGFGFWEDKMRKKIKSKRIPLILVEVTDFNAIQVSGDYQGTATTTGTPEAVSGVIVRPVQGEYESAWQFAMTPVNPEVAQKIWIRIRNSVGAWGDWSEVLNDGGDGLRGRALLTGDDLYPDPNLQTPQLYSGSTFSVTLQPENIAQGNAEYAIATRADTGSITVLTPAWRVYPGKSYSLEGRAGATGTPMSEPVSTTEVVWFSDFAATTEISSETLGQSARGYHNFSGTYTAPAGAYRARYRIKKSATTDASVISIFRLSVNRFVDIPQGYLTWDKMAMGDKSNIFIDADIASTHGYSGAPITRETTTTVGGAQTIRVSRGFIASPYRPDFEQIITPAFSVEFGKSYYLSAALGWFTGRAPTTRLYVRWYSDFAAAMLVGTDQVGSEVVSSRDVVVRSGVLTAPDNAVRARFMAEKDATGTRNSRILLSDMVVRRVLDNDLLLARPFVEPQIDAQGGVLRYRSPAGTYSDLYTKASTTQYQPASMTKLVTCMVALDIMQSNGIGLDHTITVEDGDVLAGSGNNLIPGDMLTLENAFYNMMLASSNVACQVVARTLGTFLPSGASNANPRVQFVDAMNVKAASLGATQTHFRNANGLASSGQLTTAGDMAKIIFAAAEYPHLDRVWRTPVYTVTITGVNARTFKVFNTNVLLCQPDVIGGKTGSLGTDLFNVALLARMPNGGKAAVVVLVNPTTDGRFVDARKILDAYRYGYDWPVPSVPTPRT